MILDQRHNLVLRHLTPIPFHSAIPKQPGPSGPQELIDLRRPLRNYQFQRPFRDARVCRPWSQLPAVRRRDDFQIVPPQRYAPAEAEVPVLDGEELRVVGAVDEEGFDVREGEGVGFGVDKRLQERGECVVVFKARSGEAEADVGFQEEMCED
jgi:hypothetical protein